MALENQPVLQFLTEDEHSRKLAAEYWGGSYEGDRWKWRFPVRQIASRYGVLKTNVAGTVRTIALALDYRVICTDCGGPKQLHSRSDFSSYAFSGYICDQCQANRRRSALQKQQQTTAQIEGRKSEFIRRYSPSAGGFDYRKIGYFDAVVLYAIMLASDDACETGQFEDVEGLNLCSSADLVADLIGVLFDNGILRFSPETPLASVGETEGDRGSYYPLKAVWRIERDSSGASFPALMGTLGEMIDAREEHPDFNEAVGRLWWLLACDDAQKFLLEEVDKYRIAEYKRGPKTNEAIRHALERFSIPQVRRQIGYVVKNAAALSVSRDFSARHALNTIPGRLISHVDRAISEKWTIYPVLNDWMNEEPILMTVLFNRVFGTGLPGFKTMNGRALDYEAPKSE